MSDYGSQDVLCPFYQRSDALKVKCEGITGDNKIHLVFKASERREIHMQNCCCDKFEHCLIFKMLEEKHNKRLQTQRG